MAGFVEGIFLAPEAGAEMKSEQDEGTMKLKWRSSLRK